MPEPDTDADAERFADLEKQLYTQYKEKGLWSEPLAFLTAKAYAEAGGMPNTPEAIMAKAAAMREEAELRMEVEQPAQLAAIIGEVEGILAQYGDAIIALPQNKGMTPGGVFRRKVNHAVDMAGISLTPKQEKTISGRATDIDKQWQARRGLVAREKQARVAAAREARLGLPEPDEVEGLTPNQLRAAIERAMALYHGKPIPVRKGEKIIRYETQQTVVPAERRYIKSELIRLFAIEVAKGLRSPEDVPEEFRKGARPEVADEDLEAIMLQ
jgi:hypothetical protein